MAKSENSSAEITNHSTYNNRIEYVRSTLGYPHDVFAKKLGVSTNAVHRVTGPKKAQPSIQMVQSIIKMFPVDANWLFTGNGEPWEKDITEYKYREDTGLVTANKDIPRDINQRFRDIRLSTGLSQAAFADEIGVSRDIVSSIENFRQNISMYILMVLRDKYNINMNWLFYGEGRLTRSEDKQATADIEALIEKKLNERLGNLP